VVSKKFKKPYLYQFILRISRTNSSFYDGVHAGERSHLSLLPVNFGHMRPLVICNPSGAVLCHHKFCKLSLYIEVIVDANGLGCRLAWEL